MKVSQNNQRLQKTKYLGSSAKNRVELEDKLNLKVNISKSAVERPWKRKFLGFTLGLMFGKAYSGISKQSLKKHKDKLRDILSRSKPMTLEQRIIKLNQANIGWINYYGIAKCKRITIQLDKWIKHRLRMCIWKQWKSVKTRYRNLKKLGLNHYKAIKFANTRKGYWRTANSPILNTTLTNQFFNDLGLKSLTYQYMKIHAVYQTGMHGGVRGRKIKQLFSSYSIIKRVLYAHFIYKGF
ncbi:group II intron maturase-specific domain-containing protein [Clostridium tertium]